MTVATVLPARPEFDLDDFDLELNLAVTGGISVPQEPAGAVTNYTCSSSCQTSTINTCVDERGGTCCL